MGHFYLLIHSQLDGGTSEVFRRLSRADWGVHVEGALADVNAAPSAERIALGSK